MFELGLMIKLFVVVLLIDECKVMLNMIINMLLGIYKIGLVVIYDMLNYGLLMVLQVLQKLSNVVFVKLVLNLFVEMIWNKYQEYGIGCVLELMFLGVVLGWLCGYKCWWLIEQVMMVYGYGLLMLLLQIVQIYIVYVGDGMLYLVLLLKNGIDQQMIDVYCGYCVMLL